MLKYIFNYIIYLISFWALTASVFFIAPCLADNYLDGSKERLQSVTLQLKWKHQFQFAGYYAALEKGYYKDAGLDVNILEIKGGEESTDTVLEGKADFGIAMSDLVLKRVKGQPVVALAAIFQHSPLILLSQRNSGIENIHSFKGKRLGLEAHSTELMAYLENEGISLEKNEILPHGYSVSNLISGKVDAISAYSTDEPFMLLKEGIEYSMFTPRSGGIDFYGDVLFTSETQISDHPERVAAFLEASLKGWQYALENSGEIAELILSKYTQRHSREHLLFEAQNSKKLIMADVVQLGYMHTGRWNHIAQTYAKLGMIDQDYSLNGFMYAPDSGEDYSWLMKALQGVIAICLFLGVGALILIFFNRKLAVEVIERKRAEEELRESEEKFRMLFESSKDANYICTLEGDIIDANQSFLDLFGYSNEELVDLTLPNIYFNPDDTSKFIDLISRHGFVKDFEAKLQKKNGSAIDGLITATIRRSAGGAAIGYQGIIRDVTMHRRKQKEMESLITELQNALSEIKTLSGLLPICSYCKKVRDDKGYWNQIEEYLNKHSEADLSHSICPDCAKEYFPDMDLYDD